MNRIVLKIVDFSRRSGFVMILCSITALTQLSTAQRCGSLDRIGNALRLTQMVFPGLSGEELSVAFPVGPGPSTVDVRYLNILIDKPVWHDPAGDAAQVSEEAKERFVKATAVEPPISLSFDFVRSATGNAPPAVQCRPVMFRVNTDGKKRQAALELINSHPEWTDEAAISAVQQHWQMRFGPTKKAELLRALPLRALGRLYGPLKIKEALFSVGVPHSQDTKGSFAEFRWMITAHEINTSRELAIFVEPFGGAIDALTETNEHNEQDAVRNKTSQN